MKRDVTKITYHKTKSDFANKYPMRTPKIKMIIFSKEKRNLNRFSQASGIWLLFSSFAKPDFMDFFELQNKIIKSKAIPVTIKKR